jgi:hypothetical protein
VLRGLDFTLLWHSPEGEQVATHADSDHGQ